MIVIQIPDGFENPILEKEFTESEKYLALKLGIDVVLSIKKDWTGILTSSNETKQWETKVTELMTTTNVLKSEYTEIMKRQQDEILELQRQLFLNGISDQRTVESLRRELSEKEKQLEIKKSEEIQLLKMELFEKEKQLENVKNREIKELLEKHYKDQSNYEAQYKEVNNTYITENINLKNQIQTIQANMDLLVEKERIRTEKEVKELWHNETTKYKEQLEKANKKILEQCNEIEYEKLQKQLVIQQETLRINAEFLEKCKISEVEMKKKYDILEQQYRDNEERLKQQYRDNEERLKQKHEMIVEESKKMDNEKQKMERAFAEFKLSSQYEIQKLERKYKEDSDKLLSISTEELKKQLQVLQIENDELRNKEREIYLNEILRNNEEREESKKQMYDLNTKLETIQKSSSNKIKGVEGETEFYNLALETFKDFSMFDISDRTKIPHNGDFHLTFENFTVLVDCKNYIHNVGANNRDKIRNDMNNTQIKIAWMVSLSSAHDKFGKHPFMIDYLDIEHERCIIYVNSLLNHTNPQELLKTVWYTSDMIHRMVLSRDDNVENLKAFQKHVYDCAKKMEEITKRQVQMIDQCKELFGDSNKIIKDLLMNEFVKAKDISVVGQWFYTALVKNPLAKKTITSKIIHERFNNDCPHHHISELEFKSILENILESEFIRKPNTTGKLSIIGHSWISN
jgi:hypothetical protein